MDQHFYCVITAGGLGKKLWPVSKEAVPKQFIAFTDSEKSMLRMTYERFAKIIPAENIMVVTHYNYKDLVKEQIPELAEKNIFVEPYGRNTAPCLLFSAYKLLKRDPEAVIISSPSDQVITDENKFKESVELSLEYASKHESLITMGIIPNRPDTKYGYIQADYDPERDGNMPVKAKTFTEKPDLEMAEVLFQSGEFFWNSGIYIWKAENIKKEMEKYEPEITSLFNGWDKSLDTEDETMFLEKAYADCLNISIEFAVIEKTELSFVLPVHFGWQDIGTWESVHGFMLSKDNAGASEKSYRSIKQNCRDTVLYSTEKNKLVVIKGLEDYIVINTDDVLMICPKDDKQIKELTANLAMPDFEEFR